MLPTACAQATHAVFFIMSYVGIFFTLSLWWSAML